ncbi:MAG: xanthine dehydrogenase family protein molybdopterin-binding subunit [Eubacteriales bacterium]|nr:xanthine dehydrogenase family protein molybdopterin-binding subunit [Eubacteriales bacterium]
MTYKKSDQDQTSASTKVKTTTDLESKLKQLAASVPLSSIGTEDVYVDQAGKVGVMGNYQTVGHPEERKDAREKVTGEAVFGPDVEFPNMLYAAVYHSPYAHARILSYDLEDAKAVEGVVCVLTGKDVPGRFGAFIADQSTLAVDKVRYNGEPVVAIAAETAHAAKEAVQKVKVEYEELEAVTDPYEAMQPGAPLVHDNWSGYAHAADFTGRDGTNLCDYFPLRHGDVEKGFEEADIVVENTYRTAGVNHSTIELHVATAKFDIAKNRLTIWSPTQSPFMIRKQLAGLLGLKQSEVRIVCTYIGGGFGGKYEIKIEPIVAALAMHCQGRAVRLVYNRHEDYLAGCVRGGTVIKIKSACNRDGKMVAQKIENYFDTGAYSTTGPRINYNAGLAAISPYKIPNVWIDGYTVATNRQITSAYRGFGMPEYTFAFENQMDLLADKLGMDPYVFRMKNIYHTGDVSATGEILPEVGLEKCFKAAAQMIGWEKGDWRRHVTEDGKWRAKGMAGGIKLTGTPSSSSVVVRFNDDATVQVSQSGMELGQGAFTVIPQFVAERLGIPYENVSVVPVDTMYTPYEKTTTGSRVTFHVGNAAVRAAEDVIDQLCDLCAIGWEADRESIRFDKGVIFGPMGKKLVVKDIGKTSLMKEQDPILGRGTYSTSDIWDKPDPDTHASKKPTVQWFWAAQACEVEVDPKTGKIRILDYAAAQDVGRAINTMNCVQQVEGAVVMGMSHCMLEELLDDEQGHLLNGNMVDFKVATSQDTDFDIKVALIENPVSDNLYGARGIGEPPVVPPAAAISNAVSRACGGRILSIPLKCEKVLDAVKKGPYRKEAE